MPAVTVDFPSTAPMSLAALSCSVTLLVASVTLIEVAFDVSTAVTASFVSTLTLAPALIFAAIVSALRLVASTSVAATVYYVPSIVTFLPAAKPFTDVCKSNTPLPSA